MPQCRDNRKARMKRRKREEKRLRERVPEPCYGRISLVRTTTPNEPATLPASAWRELPEEIIVPLPFRRNKAGEIDNYRDLYLGLDI